MKKPTTRNKFKKGDIVICKDNTPSDQTHRPTSLTVGKEYLILESQSIRVRVTNDKRKNGTYWFARFEKKEDYTKRQNSLQSVIQQVVLELGGGNEPKNL
jgi:hypothetical protein